MPPNNRQNTLARAEKWAQRRFPGIWQLLDRGRAAKTPEFLTDNPAQTIQSYLMPSFGQIIDTHGSRTLNQMLDLEDAGARITPIDAGGGPFYGSVDPQSYIFQIDNIPHGTEFMGRKSSQAAVDPLGGRNPFAFDLEGGNRVWLMSNPGARGSFILNTVLHGQGGNDWLRRPAAALWLGAHRGGKPFGQIVGDLVGIVDQMEGARRQAFSRGVRQPETTPALAAERYLINLGWEHFQHPPVPNKAPEGTEHIRQEMFGDRGLPEVSHEAFTGLLTARIGEGAAGGLPAEAFVITGIEPYDAADFYSIFHGYSAHADRYSHNNKWNHHEDFIQRYATELITKEKAPEIMRPYN